LLKKGLYKHYKGGVYEVMDEAIHSESLEPMVLYRSLNGSEKYPAGTLWVRPRKMFEEKVTVDGTEVLRFAFISTR
jgi:hypothetical protein